MKAYLNLHPNGAQLLHTQHAESNETLLPGPDLSDVPFSVRDTTTALSSRILLPQPSSWFLRPSAVQYRCGILNSAVATLKGSDIDLDEQHFKGSNGHFKWLPDSTVQPYTLVLSKLSSYLDNPLPPPIFIFPHSPGFYFTSVLAPRTTTAIASALEQDSCSLSFPNLVSLDHCALIQQHFQLISVSKKKDSLVPPGKVQRAWLCSQSPL